MYKFTLSFFLASKYRTLTKEMTLDHRSVKMNKVIKTGLMQCSWVISSTLKSTIIFVKSFQFKVYAPKFEAELGALLLKPTLTLKDRFQPLLKSSGLKLPVLCFKIQ